MKKLILISFVLGVILCFSTCKKDCNLIPPPPPIDTIPDTTNCNPVYHYLTQGELSFVNFLYGDTLRYYKKNNSPFLFDRILIADTFAKDCNNAFEYIASAYLTTNNISEIYYLIFPHDTAHFPQNFFILIGQNSCTSTFKINTQNDNTDLDSIQLLDKTFYDVYNRTDNFGCASEMYYNKQYGVVGFNWLGEWYVLETDSLKISASYAF